MGKYTIEKTLYSDMFMQSLCLKALNEKLYGNLTLVLSNTIYNLANNWLTLFYSMFPFDLPVNRKQKVFWCFQGYQKVTLERKELKVLLLLFLLLLLFKYYKIIHNYLTILKNWGILLRNLIANFGLQGLALIHETILIRIWFKFLLHLEL